MTRTREYEILPAKLVRDSAFDVEIHFDAPFGFWEEDPEPPYLDPAQKYFWKRAIPEHWSEEYTWKDQWVDDFHNALRKRGWPNEYTEAIYSYSEGDPWNPDEGEERDPDIQPVIGFWVRIPGDWLVEHPEFLRDLEKLEKRGIDIKVKGKKETFRLAYWRISADHGDLGGADWEHSIFLVRPPREKPEAFEGGPRDWFPE